MYYKAALKLGDYYKGKDTDKVLEIINEIKRELDHSYSVSFLPYLIADDKLFITFSCTKDCFDYDLFDLLVNHENTVLDMEETMEISPIEYYAKMESAVDQGYIVEGAFSESTFGISINNVPKERITMPFNSDHPITLKNEIERIERLGKDIKSHSISTPLNYYILSRDKNRRNVMRNNLLKSLKENNRLNSSYYGYVDVTKNNDEDYPISIDILKNTFRLLDESAVVITLDNKQIFDNKEDMEEFTKAFSYSSDSIIIIESNYYDNSLMKTLSEEETIYEYDENDRITGSRIRKGLQFVLIQDPGYTKEEAQRIISSGMSTPNSFYHSDIYKEMSISGKSYYSYDEIQELSNREKRDRVANDPKLIGKAEYEENPLLELMKMPHLKKAKELIKDILSYSYMLDEKKLRGLNSNNSPALAVLERGNKGKSKTLRTDIPSINMIFYGGKGTEKESVARLYSKILKKEGILNETLEEYPFFINKSHLMGKSPRATVSNVIDVFNKAQGGLLYIDWQELCIDEEKRDYDIIVLDTILKYMNLYKEKLIVILSLSDEGYREIMNQNPSLFASVPYALNFSSYNDEL